MTIFAKTKFKFMLYLLPLFWGLALNKCQTPGQLLKEKSESFYNLVTGKWYILSEKKFGEILHEFELKDDGNVIGAPSTFFDCDGSLKWQFEEWRECSLSFCQINFACNGKYEYRDKDKRSNYQYKIFNKNHSIEYGGLYKENIPPFLLLLVNYKEASIFWTGGYEAELYVFAKDNSVIQEILLSPEREKMLKEESTALSNLDKNSVKKILEFLKQNWSNEALKQVKDSLFTLLDKKVNLYLAKNYPSFAKLSNADIVWESDGKDFGAKFYELFRTSVTGINHKTGLKAKVEIADQKKDSFNIVIKIATEKILVSARIFKDKIIITGLEQNSIPIQRNWENAAGELFNEMIKYPDLENIDEEFLENLK